MPVTQLNYQTSFPTRSFYQTAPFHTITPLVMNSEKVERLVEPKSPRPGRMKRAQSAFKVKMKRGDSQPRPDSSAQPATPMRPSTLARKGWRGLYARKARRQRTPQETMRDVEKSKVLFGELFLGFPMLTAAASSMFTERGDEPRVPVLLPQISVHVEPMEDSSNSSNRKTLVKIYLEYGSGATQLKWSIIRSYHDFMYFQGHLRKSYVLNRRANPKPPHLPRPKDYGRKANVKEGELNQEDAHSIESNDNGEKSATLEIALKRYLERVLATYSFRGDSNRVLHFLELSRLGLTLAAGTNFHGKEGPIFIRGRASEQGWSVSHWHPHDITSMIQRHTQKWLLVRESYLILTDSINSTNILDVFLVDPKFTIETSDEVDLDDPTNAKGLFLAVRNGVRTLRIATRGELDLGSWLQGITSMQQKTLWSKPHRFDSFAPVRENVSCEWFVDGRDYFWVLSDALENARDTIFIHDWWLSPELYLRRPPEGNQKWRLDRTLRRAADRGVKIFVIVYRNIDLAIPIDSLWTKHSLFDLSPNIHVLRSPNQPKQKEALFWAHHEKLCIIDNTIAFAGGIDLCFGRWDTPQHTVIDDALKPFFESSEEAELTLSKRPLTQSWPGKDYSNPRVKDFFELDKPFDDMYDRQAVPRMPWHDVHQSVLGQPARDLGRHFVQRWNYVVRQKLPSRPTPLLLPPPDFTEEEIRRLKLSGTCEYQVLRSSCNWSLGLKEHEQSIQNAYVKLIDTSEHFIYIENQFFITATEVDDVKIENEIGTALVQRIIRAHEQGEHWRAIIVIPLMPGFEAPVDSAEASSVRVICQCQYNSISRGVHSIFYRLESAGIIPDNYISFFSLRKWGKIGPDSRLTTEQLYIHAKAMVADDRVAIIGSANINERSMRGNRDSEVAVCVRDTATIESRMAGKPYKVGKFAHTLRVRLMREHMGIDIDKVDCIDQLDEYLSNQASGRSQYDSPMISRSNTPLAGSPPPGGHLNGTSGATEEPVNVEEEGTEGHSFNWLGGTEQNPGVRDRKKFSTDRRIQGNDAHRKDVDGYGFDQWAKRVELEKAELEVAINPAIDQSVRDEAMDILVDVVENYDLESHADFKRIFYNLWCKRDDGERVGSLPIPIVDEEGKVTFNESFQFDPWAMDDPVSDEFYLDKWHASAERNTVIYRQVFRCQPDNEVETWKDYKKYQAHEAAFYEKQASSGGTEAKNADRAPQTVNIHVNRDAAENLTAKHLSSSGDAEQSHDPRTGEPVPGTIVQPTALPGSAKRGSNASASQAGTESNGVGSSQETPEPNGKTHGETNGNQQNGRARSDSSSSGSSTSSSSTSSSIGEYQGNAGGSTTAGIPGIPSLGNLFGRNKPFKPKKLTPEEETRYQQQLEDNDALHAHSSHEDGEEDERPRDLQPKHKNRRSRGKLGKFFDAPDSLAIDKLRLNRRSHTIPEHLDEEEEDESPDSPKSKVQFPAVDGPVRHQASDDKLSSLRTSADGQRRMTLTNRRWKHFEQILSAQSAEEVLSAVSGHLVVFPTEWLRKEIDSGNWNFQMDRMTPLHIYD